MPDKARELTNSSHAMLLRAIRIAAHECDGQEGRSQVAPIYRQNASKATRTRGQRVFSQSNDITPRANPLAIIVCDVTARAPGRTSPVSSARSFLRGRPSCLGPAPPLYRGSTPAPRPRHATGTSALSENTPSSARTVIVPPWRAMIPRIERMPKPWLVVSPLVVCGSPSAKRTCPA